MKPLKDFNNNNIFVLKVWDWLFFLSFYSLTFLFFCFTLQHSLNYFPFHAILVLQQIFSQAKKFKRLPTISLPSGRTKQTGFSNLTYIIVPSGIQSFLPFKWQIFLKQNRLRSSFQRKTNTVLMYLVCYIVYVVGHYDVFPKNRNKRGRWNGLDLLYKLKIHLLCSLQTLR